jgi:hypothetical protein
MYFSFYLLACKYYQEGKHGVIVEDGGDSRKDEIFLKFKEEKSTEGLSESFVQFTNQFCFMVFFIFMSQIEVLFFKVLKPILIRFFNRILCQALLPFLHLMASVRKSSLQVRVRTLTISYRLGHLFFQCQKLL